VRQLRKSRGPPAGPPIGPFVGKLDTRAVATSIRLSLSFAVFSALVDPARLLSFSTEPPLPGDSSLATARLIYVIMRSYRDLVETIRASHAAFTRKSRGDYRTRVSSHLPFSTAPFYRGIPLTRLASHYTFRIASFPGCINRTLAYTSGAPAR